MRQLAVQCTLAFVAGGLWAWCFGEKPLLLAPWLALVPLCLFLGGPRPGLAGWAHGLGFWVVGISWIPATLRTFGGLPAWLAAGALLLLAGYLALYHAVFARLAAWFWKRGGASVFWVLPALWVALELVRSRLFTGFPWNLAGYSTAGFPGAFDAAAWIGSYGLSALVVLVNVAVGRALVARQGRAAAWAVLGALLLLGVAGRAGEIRSAEAPAGARRSVVLLQPNIGNLTEWDAVQAEANYRKVFELSQPVCRPGDLLVWPESAAWPHTFEPGSRLHRDVGDLVASGCTVLFNVPFLHEGQYYNSALLESASIPSEGPGRRYDKQHLVPFGEYVPLGRWLPFLQRVARAAGDFVPGPQAENVAWGSDQLGVAICFEITFPEEVAGKVDRGASVLVTMTNDAWYGDTWAPWQHLMAARFRAAENHRPVLRAAITGVSALIGPRGEVIRSLGVDQEGVIDATVEGSHFRTLYSRAPSAIPGAAFLAIAFAIFRRFRASRP